MGNDTSFDPDRPEPPVTPGHVAWGQVERVEPAFAAAVLSRFTATKHHVLATLRVHGAPRVSGTEVIVHDGQLALGSMLGAVKALDLARDGRFALHANPGDGSMEHGDAKVAGTAVELGGSLGASIAAQLEISGPFHLFRLDLSQVVLSEVDHDRGCMVIRSWWPDRGMVVQER